MLKDVGERIRLVWILFVLAPSRCLTLPLCEFVVEEWRCRRGRCGRCGWCRESARGPLCVFVCLSGCVILGWQVRVGELGASS